MKNRVLVFVSAVAAFAAAPMIFAQAPRPAAGQTAPRAAATTIPRTADGKPNFAGLWTAGGGGGGGGGQAEPTVYQGGNAPRQLTRRERGLADKNVSFAPWGKEAFLYYTAADGAFGGETGGPGDARYHGGTCGGPKSPSDLGGTIQAYQTPQLLMLSYVSGQPWVRNIWIGKQHPADITDLVPFWMGHSVGKWEGDTLVVDTVRIKEGTMLDSGRALPQSGNLHMIERIHFENGNLKIDRTLTDPVAYTKPITDSRTYRMQTDMEDAFLDWEIEETHPVCEPKGGYWAENDPWFDNYDKIQSQILPDLEKLKQGPPPVPAEFKQK